MSTLQRKKNMTLEESDLLMLTLAFDWFDERIEDLPV